MSLIRGMEAHGPRGYLSRRNLAAERFAPRISPEPNTGCWLWTGAYNEREGYGIFTLYGKPHNAHRAAWRIFKGEIPDGLHVDHLCRNRACVNPDHLEPVTIAENTRRGRVARAAQ